MSKHICKNLPLIITPLENSLSACFNNKIEYKLIQHVILKLCALLITQHKNQAAGPIKCN